MTATGITKAALEKQVKDLLEEIAVREEINSAYEKENIAYRAAITPLIPIARQMVEIYARRNAKPETGIDIGLRFDVLERIAALDDDDGDRA